MKQSLLPYFLLAILTLLLDQATKLIVKLYVHRFETIEVLPFLNIVYAENTGSAFGLFKELGSTFFIIISLVAIVLITFLLIKERDNRISYALLLGGAAGNLIDRVIYGYVIDFIELHAAGFYWPIFNIADSALTIGIFLLLYKTIFPKKIGQIL